MKTTARSDAVLFLVLVLGVTTLAEDSPVTDSAQIIGRIADGTPPRPQVPKELAELRVLDTHVHPREGRSLIIQEVEAPAKPAEPETADAPRIDPNDPEVLAWIERQRGAGQEHRFAIVSATVIDHSVTLLRWWVYGNEGPPEQFSGSSNVDFNHLSGFGSYEVGNVRYSLLMAIGNTDTQTARKLCKRHGVPYEAPEIPEMPAGDDAYVITEGDMTHEKGLAVMDGLHALYVRGRRTAWSPHTKAVNRRARSGKNT